MGKWFVGPFVITQIINMLALIGVLSLSVYTEASVSTLINPCLNQSSGQADLPWCDHTLPVDVRVDDMISRMTLDEKN